MNLTSRNLTNFVDPWNKLYPCSWQEISFILVLWYALLCLKNFHILMLYLYKDLYIELYNQICLGYVCYIIIIISSIICTVCNFDNCTFDIEGISDICLLIDWLIKCSNTNLNHTNIGLSMTWMFFHPKYLYLKYSC